MKPIVISLCDYTARMLEPWAEAGFECYAVDIQHPPGQTQIGNNITAVGADILDCVSAWMPQGRTVKIAFGFPPCTHTAVSGARHFLKKGIRKAAEAFALIARVDQLLNYFGCPYAWEQPVATTSTYCGPPTYTFDPCDYAGYLTDPATDAYTKKTCLWAGAGFIMPEPKRIEPVKVCKSGSWVMQLGGSSQRTKNLRSATPAGFAKAVFLANNQERE
ncbi:MAG: hypothetical protein FWD61_03400 [Phycisphaerales bacterium]|nr:hypothetical protein [Phycisphaerales bacterium]